MIEIDHSKKDLNTFVMWLSSVVASRPDYHAKVREFDFRLGKVRFTCHPFGVDKISTKLTWELRIARLFPSDRVI